jgi:undecaprenyl diphosphate synthase
MSDQPANSQFTRLPNHIAIIMDGNGRWAAARGLHRLEGHKAGTDNLRRVIRACIEFGVPYLTVYAFSTENWGRPKDEVTGLMHILEEMIDQEFEELHQQGVRLVHIGRLEGLSPLLREKVLHAMEMTKNNSRLVLCLAWNYGGRDEIVWAVQSIMREGISPDQVTPEVISSHLFTANIPDPDLIIRTSGEMRISNFLIWQSAYAEWYITDIYWPDFDKEELRKALESYACRERRFGRLPSGCEETPPDAT